MLVIYCCWVFVCERCRRAEVPPHHENQGLNSVVRLAPQQCLPAEPFCWPIFTIFINQEIKRLKIEEISV